MTEAKKCVYNKFKAFAVDFFFEAKVWLFLSVIRLLKSICEWFFDLY